MNKKFANEAVALAVALLAAALGVGYYLYISAVDFPVDAARIVPLLWLILAASSLVLATRMARKSYIFFTVMAVSIPSLSLALIFAIAVMLGD